jgi:plasmid maintenance system antidote protein VapI
MKLRDPQLLADYMALQDISQSRLARQAGCSRQFVWQLLNDPGKDTCTDEMAARIEQALSVLPGTIFRPTITPGRGGDD